MNIKLTKSQKNVLKTVRKYLEKNLKKENKKTSEKLVEESANNSKMNSKRVMLTDPKPNELTNAKKVMDYILNNSGI